MIVKAHLLSESSSTFIAPEWSFPGVEAQMAIQVAFLRKSFFTKSAPVRFFSSVDYIMNPEI